MSKAIKFRNKNNEPVYPCPYYPIGSIYMSIDATNPSTYFGGTWEQIRDRFLLGCGNKASGITGGNLGDIIQSIGVTGTSYGGIGASPNHYSARVMSVSPAWTNDQSSMKYMPSYESDYLPPYLTVYIWKRVS